MSSDASDTPVYCCGLCKHCARRLHYIDLKRAVVFLCCNVREAVTAPGNQKFSALLQSHGATVDMRSVADRNIAKQCTAVRLQLYPDLYVGLSFPLSV